MLRPVVYNSGGSIKPYSDDKRIALEPNHYVVTFTNILMVEVLMS